jgi:hypothetical protein
MTKHKYLGYKGKSKRCGSFEVVEYEGKNLYKIYFPSTGYTTSAISKNITDGSIKDPLYPSILGVGCVGIGDYKCAGKGRRNTPEYEVWRGMLRRCHDKNSIGYVGYGMRGVTLQSSWYNFQNFAEWYTKQDLYSEGWDLDKDLLDYRALMYSEDTCTLVPSAINSLFTGGFKTITPKRRDKWVVQLQMGKSALVVTSGNLILGNTLINRKPLIYTSNIK